MEYSKKDTGFKFENLHVWQRAMDLGEQVHQLTKNFPREEQYNLVSQMRRSADSVALNIAEGSILQDDNDFKRYLGYSVRSLAEVVTCLQKARLRMYFSEQECQNLYTSCFNLMNMLIAFRKTSHQKRQKA